MCLCLAIALQFGQWPRRTRQALAASAIVLPCLTGSYPLSPARLASLDASGTYGTDTTGADA